MGRIIGSSASNQATANGGVIEPSRATRVWATDWTGDGLLDLLVGDSATIVNPKEGIDPAEYERRSKEIAERMAAVTEKQQSFMPRYQAAVEAREEPDEELTREMEKASSEFQELYNAKSEFQDSQSTGFVWLFVRK